MSEQVDPTREAQRRLGTEITRMSRDWYAYVGRDHHKDRDCHWIIDITWSYGEEPRFTPSHYGYIGERWTGARHRSLLPAMQELHGHLLSELRGAWSWGNEPDDEWNDDVKLWVRENLGDYAP